MIRVLLTANSAGAVVMFSADSINAAQDVVFGWILSSKEKDGSLNQIKRSENVQPVGCLRSLRLSTGIASRSHVTASSVMHNSRFSFKSFYEIEKCVFVRSCADPGAWTNSC